MSRRMQLFSVAVLMSLALVVAAAVMITILANVALFQLARIEAFVPVSAFDARVEELVSHVKSSRPEPGGEGVKIPGEPESESALRLTHWLTAWHRCVRATGGQEDTVPRMVRPHSVAQK